MDIFEKDGVSLIYSFMTGPSLNLQTNNIPQNCQKVNNINNANHAWRSRNKAKKKKEKIQIFNGIWNFYSRTLPNERSTYEMSVSLSDLSLKLLVWSSVFPDITKYPTYPSIIPARLPEWAMYLLQYSQSSR